MTYRLDLDGEARVLLSHMPPSQKRRIKESLRSIAKNPFDGKALQEGLSDLNSYRTGSLRIVYSIDSQKKTVHVVAIGPRRTVYKELERELRAKRR